jgi:HK97 family phage major capsid protein
MTLRDELNAANDELARHQDELREIHERAGNRALTPGEQERFDRITRAREKAHARLEAVRTEMSDALLRAVEDGSAVTVRGDCFGDPLEYTRAGVTYNSSKTVHRGGQTRGEALRFISNDPAARDDVKQTATLLVERDGSGDAAKWATVAANPHYLNAYMTLMVNPERGHLSWSTAERQAFTEAENLTRAMNIGTPASGGHLMPLSLDPTLILTNDGTINPIRAISRQATITTSSWNGITTAGVSAEWKSEAAQAADASPSDLAQPSIDVHLADVYVQYSIEAEQDLPNLAAELGEAMRDAKDRHEATAFTTGDGSGKPKGIITALAADAGSLVTPTTAETFALADIYKVAAALPARHLANAQWMANHTLEFGIRQFATGDGANSAFWADLGDGTPPRLLGRNYNGCSDMDGAINPAATANNYLLLFGDFSKYQVVNRVGATTEFIPHIMGANGRPTLQRGVVMYWRVGADALDTNAFRLLNVATTA